MTTILNWYITQFCRGCRSLLNYGVNAGGSSGGAASNGPNGAGGSGSSAGSSTGGGPGSGSPMHGGFYLLYDETQENDREKEGDEDEYDNLEYFTTILLSRVISIFLF